MPVTASLNTYAAWDDGASTYATLEAAPTYGVLEGARLTVTHTLSSSGSVLVGRRLQLSFGGTLGASGTLPKQATHTFLGTLTSAAVVQISKILARSFGGALGSSGIVNRLQMRGFVVTANLGLSGSATLRLLYSYYISLDAYLRVFGDLKVRVKRGPWPPLTSMTPTSPPTLVGSSAGRLPELQPASKPTWPPFHANSS